MRAGYFREYSKWRYVLLALAAALLGLVLSGVRAGAAGNGSIELQIPQEAVQEAAGAEVTLYAVADIVDAAFVYREPFTGVDFTLLDLRDAEKVEKAAEQFDVLAREGGAEGIRGTVGEDGLLRFTGLEDALYLAVQTGGRDQVEIQKALIPVPYTREDGTMCYEVEIAPKYTIPDGAVILHKENEAGEAVAGAVFALQKKTYVSDEGEIPDGVEGGQDVGGRYVWMEVESGLVTDARGGLFLNGLSRGTYRFVEQQVPEGFILNPASAYFSVETAGQVQELDGVLSVVRGEPAQVAVTNERTTLTINKVDGDGRAVPGAVLVIKDASGNVIRNADGSAKYQFTTTDQPYELKGLPAGEYFVSEAEAPDGYQVAQDVRVTVSDSADAQNTVTMVDERLEPADGTLQVTKELRDTGGRAVAVNEGVFYVALFADEARTERVTDVQALRYSGSSSATAAFGNLETGKMYYVGETTQYGELVTGGELDGGSYTPQYPDGYTVRLTVQQPAGALTFENVFYDLPNDYYLEGELTVTKKTVRGGSSLESDDVFYAGIFTDAQHTQRYGDVITLDMNGGSESSVVVPVEIGRSMDDSATYYVTETDKDGKPLGNSANLGFTFTVDKTSVTLGGSQTEGSVTITNTFPEGSSGRRSESGGSSGGSGSGSSSNGNVRTGDETPILPYAVLCVLAVCVLGAGFAGKRKKRS